MALCWSVRHASAFAYQLPGGCEANIARSSEQLILLYASSNAGCRCDGDEVFGDVAAEVDDDFDVFELGSRGSGAVVDADVVVARYEVGYFGIPGF